MVEYTARNGARPVDQGNHFGPTGLLSVSPVPLRVQSDGRGLPLPLNLIAMIIAQVRHVPFISNLALTNTAARRPRRLSSPHTNLTRSLLYGAPSTLRERYSTILPRS